jgi:hypothetical protein
MVATFRSTSSSRTASAKTVLSARLGQQDAQPRRLPMQPRSLAFCSNPGAAGVPAVTTEAPSEDLRRLAVHYDLTHPNHSLFPNAAAHIKPPIGANAPAALAVPSPFPLRLPALLTSRQA